MYDVKSIPILMSYYTLVILGRIIFIFTLRAGNEFGVLNLDNPEKMKPAKRDEFELLGRRIANQRIHSLDGWDKNTLSTSVTTHNEMIWRHSFP